MSTKVSQSKPKSSSNLPDQTPSKKFGAGWWVVLAFGAFWLIVGLYLMVISSGNNVQKPFATLNTPDFHALAFSPSSADTVFFGSHSGLLKSSDGGKNWQSTNLKDQDAMNISIADDGKTIYIGGHDVFFKSEDGGQSWRSLLTKLPGTDVHSFTIDPKNPNILFAGAVGVGLMRSNDGGQSWQVVTKQLGNGLSALAYGNGILWAGVSGRGVLRSEDGGQSWQAASGFANASLNSDLQIASLVFEPSSNLLYAGTNAGLYQSTEGGASWNRLNYKGMVMAVTVNPANSKLLLVVNEKGELFRSSNGGVSWGGD